MTDIMQGDPRMVLGPNGASLQFIGGQPLMDPGLENLALISLFTAPGWCGNRFVNSYSQIGSDFEYLCRQPITRSSLNQIKNAAVLALSDPAFGSVAVTVSNPDGNNLKVLIQIHPPGGTVQELTLQRSGGNWLAQGRTPVYPRINPPLPTLGDAPSGPNAQHEDWNFMKFENGDIMEF